ncbi:MAG: hypothetical protein ABSE04_04370 [Candidatus Microgenomates bacterium]|jgi:hypothetical protein
MSVETVQTDLTATKKRSFIDIKHPWNSIVVEGPDAEDKIKEAGEAARDLEGPIVEEVMVVTDRKP